MKYLYRMFGVLVVLLGLAAVPGCANGAGGFRVDLLVDGYPKPVYYAQGIRYVEAIKGREYSIRLHNPLGVRVAVALSVDGLNSIDARRTDARSAQKWVLGPYETITISGWQTSMQNARHFYFTTEEQSYAQWLGKTDNLGIISAVYFRERVPRPLPAPVITPKRENERGRYGEGADAASRDQSKAQNRAEPAPGMAQSAPEASQKMRMPPQPADEYAATGIGNRYDHRVERIQMDLEDRPVATVNIRYEYRPQLVRLGIFPPTPARYPDPLARRQHARGFDGSFCPEPR